MKKTRETKQVHFTVEGLYIAEMARTRMQEGNYQSGLRILECLEGMPLEDQIAILRGKKTLNGENFNIQLIEESPQIKQEMEDWHEKEFGGIFSFNGKLFQPYAYIQSWSQEDLPTSGSRFSPLANQFTREFEIELHNKVDSCSWGELLGGTPHSRSLHYAENPSQDVALTIDANNFNIGEIKNLPFNGKAVVLFKAVTEQLPFWAEEYYAKTPIEAILNTAKIGYKLQKEGAENYIDENVVADFFQIQILKI